MRPKKALRKFILIQNHVCNPKSSAKFVNYNFVSDIVYVKQMDNGNHSQSFAARSFCSSGRELK
jgi:hypothetical protein